MTQTPHYHLSQWAKTDRIQMEPFNQDNAKLDAALEAHDTAIAARATTAALDAETAARTAAVSAETAARTGAVTAEENARKQADTALQTAINKEVSDRKAAIAAEASARNSAIAAETAARTSAVNALNTAVAKLGNCVLYTTTYVGTGVLKDTENPLVLTFPKPPKLVYVAAPQGGFHLVAAPGVSYYQGSTVYERYYITWPGNSISWCGGRNVTEQMNAEGTTYLVVALLNAGT